MKKFIIILAISMLCFSFTISERVSFTRRQVEMIYQMGYFAGQRGETKKLDSLKFKYEFVEPVFNYKP